MISFYVTVQTHTLKMHLKIILYTFIHIIQIINIKSTRMNHQTFLQLLAEISKIEQNVKFGNVIQRQVILGCFNLDNNRYITTKDIQIPAVAKGLERTRSSCPRHGRGAIRFHLHATSRTYLTSTGQPLRLRLYICVVETDGNRFNVVDIVRKISYRSKVP